MSANGRAQKGCECRVSTRLSVAIRVCPIAWPPSNDEIPYARSSSSAEPTSLTICIAWPRLSTSRVSSADSTPSASAASAPS